MINGRSRKGAWIEIGMGYADLSAVSVAPARERGLKCFLCCGEYGDLNRRSRKGAWIEIGVTNWYDPAPRVAPARERGLKSIEK